MTMQANRETNSNNSAEELSYRNLMIQAIELAQNCISEPGKLSPKVAAIIVLEGKILEQVIVEKWDKVNMQNLLF